jgi:hypothetical protein
MKPLKATILFFYTLVSIVALGVSISHSWNIRKEWLAESQKPLPTRFNLSQTLR